MLEKTGAEATAVPLSSLGDALTLHAFGISQGNLDVEDDGGMVVEDVCGINLGGLALEALQVAKGRSLSSS